LYRHHLRGVPIVITEYASDGSEPPVFADIRKWWGCPVDVTWRRPVREGAPGLVAIGSG
jgi:hypothetical protein